MCRSQVRLQKLGDQLGSDISRNGANEEDSINILSDGENIGSPVTSPHNELQNDASPGKKRLCVNLYPSEEPKQGDTINIFSWIQFVEYLESTDFNFLYPLIMFSCELTMFSYFCKFIRLPLYLYCSALSWSEKCWALLKFSCWCLSKMVKGDSTSVV